MHNYPEKEICDHYIDGKTIHWIKKLYSMSPWTIKGILAKHNLYTLDLYPEKAICDYYKTGFTLNYIVSSLNLNSSDVVRCVLLKNNVPIRRRTISKVTFKINEAEICKRYLAGESGTKLAKELYIHSNVVYDTLRRNNIPIRSKLKYRVNSLEDLTCLEDDLKKRLDDIVELKQEYVLNKVIKLKNIINTKDAFISYKNFTLRDIIIEDAIINLIFKDEVLTLSYKEFNDNVNSFNYWVKKELNL